MDHEILRLKLQSSGISGKVATWIEDYLSNRKQLTVIKTESSEVLDVSMGVPQGSLLGPRLFTVYTNDLPKAVKSGQVEMYADDTTAFSIGENIDDVCIKLQETLKEINDWCTKHKLTVHPTKTHVLIMKRHKLIGPLPEMKLGENSLEYTDVTECLGVKIDNSLNWKAQTEKVGKAFAAKVKTIRSMSYLPKDILEEIYFRTVIPVVLYIIAVWGNCSMGAMTGIERIHRTAARIIHKLDTNIPSDQVLQVAKWDSVDYMYKKRLITLMHRVKAGTINPRISSFFEEENCRYNLRNNKDFQIPQIRSESGRKSVFFRGQFLWSMIDNDIKALKQDKFKKCIHKYKDKLDKINFQSESLAIKSKDPSFVY